MPLLFAGWLVAAFAAGRLRARRAAAEEADLAEHAEWMARMRAVSAGEVTLLDQHRRARCPVESCSDPAVVIPLRREIQDLAEFLAGKEAIPGGDR